MVPKRRITRPLSHANARIQPDSTRVQVAHDREPAAEQQGLGRQLDEADRDPADEERGDRHRAHAAGEQLAAQDIADQRVTGRQAAQDGGNTLSFLRMGAFALAHCALSLVVIELTLSVDTLVLRGVLFVIGQIIIILFEGLVFSVQVTRLVLFERRCSSLRSRGRAPARRRGPHPRPAPGFSLVSCRQVGTDPPGANAMPRWRRYSRAPAMLYLFDVHFIAGTPTAKRSGRTGGSRDLCPAGCGWGSGSSRCSPGAGGSRSASATRAQRTIHDSVLVFRRREQDQLDTIRAIDIGIMAGRNLEEVAGGDARLDARLDHANYELARDAVAGVAHRA